MRVSLGTFALSRIEDRFRGDPATAVENAAAAYAEGLAEPSSRRLGVQVPVPRFWITAEAGEDTRHELDIEMGERTRQILETEAQRQGLPLETIVTHAIFVSLASSPEVSKDSSSLGSQSASVPRRRPAGTIGPSRAFRSPTR